MLEEVQLIADIYTQNQYLKAAGIIKPASPSKRKKVVYANASNRNQKEFLKQFANAKGLIVDDY